MIEVVGIGADGWAGLADDARAAVLSAETIVASARQLALLPETPARRRSCRADAIRANALRLGVPALTVIEGRAPDALAPLQAPDAIFVGGRTSEPGVLDACWTALRSGGRIVANAVTREGEQALHAARARHRGDLPRLAISHAEPLGGLEAWRPQLPVVQWSADR